MKQQVQPRDFSEENYRLLVSYLNTFLASMTLGDNMSAHPITATIPAGVEIKISHGLKTVPRYRIIVRQRGNGLITDGEEAWTDTYVTFKNNGAAAVTFTAMLLRG